MTNDFSSDLELIQITDTHLDLELRYFPSHSTFASGHDGAWATDETQPAPEIPCNEAHAPQYISGAALYTLVVGLTMAAFLLMIDSTILVTVSQP